MAGWTFPFRTELFVSDDAFRSVIAGTPATCSGEAADTARATFLCTRDVFKMQTNGIAL